jgi:hypothetical protein
MIRKEKMIKINESGADRVIRVVIGAALSALTWGGLVTGTIGLIFKIVGLLLLLTGLVGWCPIYALAKIHTKR